MGEPGDFYDPMGLDRWMVSDPFYYVGLDSVGEYVNDLVDGAVEWTDRTTGEAAKEDAKWNKVIDDQQDQVDCHLSILVDEGKLTLEEAQRQGRVFHMQQDGGQEDVRKWTEYSEQTADELSREVVYTVVGAGVGNVVGRGVGSVVRWASNTAAGRVASRWAARTGVSRLANSASQWLKKPINSQFFKRVRPSIATPYAVEIQGLSTGARTALGEARSGATLFRSGELGRSMAAESQYWSLQNPLTPGYAGQMGAPAVNTNFLMGGSLRPGAPVITNQAMRIGSNRGGGIQAVTTPGGVEIYWFVMP
jgi:hypothetical protein